MWDFPNRMFKDLEKLPQITTKMELIDSLICIDTFQN